MKLTEIARVLDAALLVGEDKLGIDIAPIVAWLTGARAPTADEAEALAKCASLDSFNAVVICERARRVISTYRAALGMPIVRTRNRKGE